MADIAINPVTRRVQFTGNTGTGPFAFTFNILADEDIQVYKNTTLLTLTTDYTVTTNANGTGSITLVAGQALISSDYLTIVGGRDLERTTDFVTGGDLLASSLNEQLDSNVIMSQQLDERFGRSISVSPGDVDVSLELPTASTRANQILSFTSTGAVTATSLDGLPEITLDKLNVDNITLDGNTISTTDTNGNLTLAPNGTGDVIVSGDLIVNGATTTISSTELDITDKNITIASGSADSSAADGAGLTVDGPDATFNYMHDLLGWQLNKPITIGNTTTDYGGALNIYGKTVSGHVQTASVVLYSDSTSLDPFIKFHAQSSNVFSMGIDFSDSAMFKITNGSSLTGGEFTITDDGEISLGTNQPQSGYRFTISGASGAQANIAFKQTGTDNAIINSFTDQMRFVGDLNNESSNTFSFKWFDGVTEKMTLEGGTLKVDTINELTSAAGVTVDGVLLKDGGATVTADVSFGTNDKAIFGAGSDLQIYHDGSNSFINDTGTGDLYIRGSNAIRLQSNSGETYFIGELNGAVYLRYDDVNKLATTSTGVDITGTITSDGLTVDGSTPSISNGTSPAAFTIGASNGAASNLILKGAAGMEMQTYNGGWKKYFNLAYTGDISFYEDTGTTAKFFWDASAELLKIGSIETIGTFPLMVKSNASHHAIHIEEASGNEGYTLGVNADGDLGFYNSGSLTASVVINDSGQVGIGTSSPSDKLHVEGDIRVNNAIESAGNLNLEAENGSMRFQTGTGSPSERMRIDSSGNLLVGTTDALPATNNDASGIALRADGNLMTSRSGAVTARFNRGTSDGDIVAFHKDGTTVGSIGTFNGDTVIGTGQAAFRFNDGIPSVAPHRMDTNNVADNLVDLGYSTGRFKDLYLSGQTHSTGHYLTGDGFLWNTEANNIRFATNNTERMRIDSSGNLLVGKTSIGTSTDGFEARAGGITGVSDTSSAALYVNRNGSDGDMVIFQKVGATVGSIASGPFSISGVGVNNTGWSFGDNSAVLPMKNSALSDNFVDLGSASYRMDDIYATNGTIQTSDQNEKQQIASLTDAEMTAAKAISKLFKTFKWNHSVAEKGDAARTHTGVIAQEVEQAMTDAGLNAGDYAFFISTTWWETQTEVPAVEADEENGVEAQEAYTRTDTYETAEEAPEGATERNRKGIRYPQLLSFIGAATEQRLVSIESRLDALEA